VRRSAGEGLYKRFHISCTAGEGRPSPKGLVDEARIAFVRRGGVHPEGRARRAARKRDSGLDASPPGMRRGDREVVPVRSCEVEGVVDPTLADLGGPKAFRRIIATRRLDIVHHQVEGRRGTARRRLFRLPDDDMRAATKFEDCEAVISEYRAQTDGLEPPLGSSDIGCRKPNMADRYWWPLINSLRHDTPFRLSAIQSGASG